MAKVPNPLVACAVAIVLFFSGLWLVGDLGDPLISFLSVCVVALTALVVAAVPFVKVLRPSFICIVSGVLALKIVLGCGHYLWFFEPSYFTQPLDAFPWVVDYAQLPDGMATISTYWHTAGITAQVPHTILGEKSLWLLCYHSLLFYFSGTHILNFTPFAALHTTLMGLIATSIMIARRATRGVCICAFCLVALAPLNWYTDLTARDYVGQLFLIMTVYAIVQYASRSWLFWVLFPLSLAAASSFRAPYPLALLAVLSLHLAFRRGTRKILTLLTIIVGALAIGGIGTTVLNLDFYRQQALLNGRTAMWFVPVGVLAHLAVGLLGPFPWTSIQADPSYWIHLPPTITQAALTLTALVLVVPRVAKAFWKTRAIDSYFLAFIMFFLSGLLSSGVHVQYTNAAYPCLLVLASPMHWAEWQNAALAVLGVYALSHLVFFFLGFQNLGAFNPYT
jgi:hypothetical protein